MKILYTLPCINPAHGGFRIVFAHIEGLRKLGHDVHLFIDNGLTVCKWYDITFPVIGRVNEVKNYDCVVIGSPHSIYIQGLIKPHQKCFLFMQMVEEKFRPNDTKWHQQCRQFYLSPFPIIHGSHWGENVVRGYGRKGEMHYIGNGVNLDHFPISAKQKDGKTVLIEGWEASNPAKDTDNIGPAVAAWLKREGYKIIAYGFQPIKTMPNVPDEYHYRPTLETMNRLYEEATILIKATRYDARALSPIEAMTKSTVTARAIIKGDDDLIHASNCLRTKYDASELYKAAKELLTNEVMRNSLASNCRDYVKVHCNWDKIINQLNQILQS